MDALINNNAILTYAWGPAFQGQGQLLAWSYDEAHQKIQFHYAKSDHILRDSTNQIRMGMKQACSWKLKDKCPDLAHWSPKKTYGPGGNTPIVSFADYGNFELNKVNGRWRFTKPGNPACYLDHVYACSKTDAATVMAGSC